MDVSMRFGEEDLPEIKSGFYELWMELDTGITEGGSRKKSAETLKLAVSAKRFSMDPNEVYSVHPAPGSEGEFGHCLPHIVFNRGTLPWEFGCADGSPGLALFLCTENEGVSKRTLKISEAGSPGSPEIFASGRLNIQDSDSESGDETCEAVDIPLALYQKLWTDSEERKILTHVRQVRLDDKVTDPLVKDGTFSCLVSNRYPKEPEDKKEKLAHRAYVVSLREYEGITIPQNAEFVRLICLYTWEFTVTKEPYDFRAAIKKLSPGILRRPAEEKGKEKELLDILKRGYCPVNHDLRDGSKTVSWYRGPWIPYGEQQMKPRYRIFSDEFYFFDPDCGMMDVSYACAWQLGRMVSFNNLSVCSRLVSWRLHNCSQAARNAQQEQLLEKIPAEGKDVKEQLKNACIYAAEQLAPEEGDEDHGTVDPGK
ncbi:hypothetical protein [Anaerostipes sp.]|uniref:hypothetical protein n=1 Tax=Anaerostipes sp. TaxID=1872530 RepID=UPI0025C16744|nr:hypothetical protein [Anaerostipes sp.]MBS7009175.1 hypothetical protein [Anaerostipes sp.]